MIATITVLVTGLMLVVTLDDAEAKGNKIVITGSAGDNVIIIEEASDIIGCLGGCTVTGPVTQSSTEIWDINPGAGAGVDDKYEINGNGGTDTLEFRDGSSTDNDKVEFENASTVKITDGAGDDKYKVKDSSGGSVEYNDGPGDDELEFEG